MFPKNNREITLPFPDLKENGYNFIVGWLRGSLMNDNFIWQTPHILVRPNAIRWLQSIQNMPAGILLKSND